MKSTNKFFRHIAKKKIRGNYILPGLTHFFGTSFLHPLLSLPFPLLSSSKSFHILVSKVRNRNTNLKWECGKVFTLLSLHVKIFGFSLSRLAFKTRLGRNLFWARLLPHSLQFYVFHGVDPAKPPDKGRPCSSPNPNSADSSAVPRPESFQPSVSLGRSLFRRHSRVLNRSSSWILLTSGRYCKCCAWQFVSFTVEGLGEARKEGCKGKC